MLSVKYTTQFKKEFKQCKKRGLQQEKLVEIVTMLSMGEPLPEKCRDHALVDSKKYKNARECHIEPDWLLIYRIFNETLILELVGTGTHGDLF